VGIRAYREFVRARLALRVGKNRARARCGSKGFQAPSGLREPVGDPRTQASAFTPAEVARLDLDVSRGSRRRARPLYRHGTMASVRL